MSMSKFASQADYWKDRAERAEAKLSELERQEPAAWMEWAENSEAYFLAYSENPEATNKPLYARPVPAEEGFVTVTTTEDGRCVMVSRTDEDHRILKVLWEAKDVPTEPVRLTEDEIIEIRRVLAGLGCDTPWSQTIRDLENAVLRKNGLLRED